MARERTRTHTHARTHTPRPHMSGTPQLCSGSAPSDGAEAHLHAQRSTFSGLSVPPVGLPPPPPPGFSGSPQPSGKTTADLRVSQQHAEPLVSLRYLFHMAQPFVSCTISLSFISLYLAWCWWGLGDVCPLSRPGPCWIVTSDRNTLRIKLAAIVQVQCSKNPPLDLSWIQRCVKP